MPKFYGFIHIHNVNMIAMNRAIKIVITFS